MSPIEDFTSLYSSYGTKSAYRAALLNFFTHIYGFHREKRNATAEEMARYEELAGQYLREVKADERDPFHDLQRFIVSMNGSAASKTVNLNLAAVREWLAHHRIKIEADDLKRIRRRLPKSRPVTQEEIITRETIAAVLQHLDIRGRAAVLFLASSGCRIGELLKIEMRDVDLTRTPAHIHIRPEITKNKEPREVFISEEAKDTLIEWLRVRDTYMEQARAKGAGLSIKYRDNDPRIFPISKTNFYVFWDNGVRKAGLFSRDEKTGFNQVRVHGLRKYFRSNMALKIPADVVEALIGHAEGLEFVYRRFTIEQLAEQYLKGMEAVTIAAGDPAVREKVNALNEENKELRARLEAMEISNQRLSNLLSDPRKIERLNKLLEQPDTS